VVYQFCRQSKYAGVVMPSHGRYVGAASRPLSEYKRKHGDRVGLNWRIPVVTGKRAVRHIVFDTNYWKSFARARLSRVLMPVAHMRLIKSSSVSARLVPEQA